jgi:hypothetical protein
MSAFILFVAVLAPADQAPAPWKAKPLTQWDVNDAQFVLADSPWAKGVVPAQVRDLSPDERRASGDMEADCCHGVGLAGIGILGPTRQAEALARAHARPPQAKVMIRWESALPVKMAEGKIGDSRIPEWTKDYYAIAIYDFPRPHRRNLASELKGVAFLKRDKRKDLKPKRVLILPEPDGDAIFVYLFPKTEEISKRERAVAFQAQIGRMVFFQYFFPEDMQIGGELQL